MIKNLLAKTTKNVYEIHCVKIDDVHKDQTVVGSISGGGKRRTKGSTTTVYNTVINSNNKLYRHIQQYNSYPFTRNDKLALLCSEQKDGIWQILALFNFTNNSNCKPLHNTLLRYLILHPLGWFMGLMLAVVVGLIVSIPAQASRGGTGIAAWISMGLVLCVIFAYLAFFFWLPYYLYHEYRSRKSAIQTLEALKNMRSEEEIKKCLARYKGKSSISENFFSNSSNEIKSDQ